MAVPTLTPTKSIKHRRLTVGADIHFCIEYYDPALTGAISDDQPASWWSVATFDLPRNYAMFSLLAGVREQEGLPPIYPPRGLPKRETLGYAAMQHLMMFDEDIGEWAENPDLHTAHWLTTGEYAAVLGAARTRGITFGEGYLAAFAAMNAFEAAGKHARCVFAFDN